MKEITDSLKLLMQDLSGIIVDVQDLPDSDERALILTMLDVSAEDLAEVLSKMKDM